MNRCFVILGMPGAGKDTQADLFAAVSGAAVVKTGQLAREAAKTNPAIDKVLRSGDLVNDSVINNMVEKAIMGMPESSAVVFDGYPRHVGQAKWLDSFLATREIVIHAVIYLELTRATAHGRLNKRGRRDDQAEIIDRRLDVFEEETQPVVEYYGAQGKLLQINGEGTIESIHQQIMDKIGALIP